MILGTEGTVIILLSVHIGRIEVKQGRGPVVDLDKVCKVLVFNVHAPQPFLYLGHILHSVVDLLGAGGIGAVITSEADLDCIEEAGGALDVRQAARLVLRQAVKELFHSEEEIKVIGIRHGEKMYETLLTNEECANAIDMGNFYRVPCDKRDLNYDKYFKDGDVERNTLTEFNSNNTDLWTVEQVKEKLMELSYVREELEAWNGK